ncbi:MAG: hypothetical protein NXI16_05295 [Alphaproteobacteria bacterium]|nr:hypothetical protein [Alphaproteobacteria bacterium]
METNGNPNVAILKQAWNLIWDSSSQYYLPSLLKNGGTIGGDKIEPMQSTTLSDIKNIPIYKSSTWGDVDISLTSLVLSGLPSIQKKSFTPADDASSVTIEVVFQSLDFKGNFEADGKGLTGCAMDEAEANANPQPIPPELAAASSGDNMTLATQYRGNLMSGGGGGPSLVATYYDNNDPMYQITSGTNSFTEAWKNYPTAGQKTSYYMAVTNAAASNPDNNSFTVGDTNYNSHAIYMQTMFYKETINRIPNGISAEEAQDDPFSNLKEAILGFKGHALPQAYQRTVGSVMTTVSNTNPNGASLAEPIEEPDWAREAREAAERDYPKWAAQAAEKEQAKVDQITTYTSTGNFDFTFTSPTITFTGTVTITGTPPNETLTVDVTKLSADIPNIKINLLNGSDPSFTSDVQSELNDADWFQSTLGTQVNNSLGAENVRNQLSTIINKALASLT